MHPGEGGGAAAVAGGERARLGIATFDSAVQFYTLRGGQAAPQMLVMPDVEDPYSPSAPSLLVNAVQSRDSVRRQRHAAPAWIHGHVPFA